MHSHAGDLRAELLQTDAEPESVESLVDAVLTGWSSADLSAADKALCVYAEKLTRDPAAMSQEDVEVLRTAGFDDEAIHDAVQVISYFNYINRVADATLVDPDPGMPPYPEG